MNNSRRILATQSDFSFKECLWFLNRNFDDCMHETGENFIRKALLVDNIPVLIEIQYKDFQLQIEMLRGSWTKSNEQAIIQFVSEWLEPLKDTKPFYLLLQKAPAISYMTTRFAGLRLIGIPDLFEALTWSIIGQQINLTFAYKLKRRIVERYGKCILHEGKQYHTFPISEVLANASVTDLREMQFSQKKAEYMIGLATIFASKELSKEKLRALPHLQDRQKALTAIRGIGIWTANYALMKSLREPTCFPYGDAGLYNALIRHGIITQKNDTVAVDEFFRAFPDWESYVVFYLWRSLAPMDEERMHHASSPESEQP